MLRQFVRWREDRISFDLPAGGEHPSTNILLAVMPERNPNTLAHKPGLSRRQFMQKAAAFGLSMSAASALWIGGARATQNSGGHVVVGTASGETSDTLDLGTTGGAHNGTVMASVRNKLVEQRVDGGLEPELATEWDASKAAGSWAFKLRKGVEFHNGKTLDAQDVVDSINIHRGPDSTSGGAAMMKIVTNVRADGDTVIFDLSEPAVDFPLYLTQNAFTIAPSINGSVDQSGVGTGAFKLEKFDPGLRAAGTRNPNYFREGRPYIDSFELISVKDLAALSNGLISGSFHAIQPVDPKTAARLDAVQGVRVENAVGGSHVTMPMMANNPPFSSVDFRLAMKYAVDREALRDRVFHGYATLANDHPVHPSDPFFNAEIPQRQFDPDKARFHIRKSGFEGKQIQIHTSDAAFPGALDAGALYIEDLKKAGVDIQVINDPIDGYWSNVWAKVPFCYNYWGARPTLDLIFSLAYVCGAAWGDTKWCHEKLTDLVAAARIETDRALRKEMYGEVQLILHEQGSSVVPVFKGFLHGISEKLDTGGAINSAQPLDNMRIFEKWSFKHA